jgi:hypothetical protein
MRLVDVSLRDATLRKCDAMAFSVGYTHAGVDTEATRAARNNGIGKVKRAHVLSIRHRWN